MVSAVRLVVVVAFDWVLGFDLVCSWLLTAIPVAYLRCLQGPPQRSSSPPVLRLPPNWYCLAVDLNMVKQFFPSPPPEGVNEV
ncbi:protein FORGETTER 1 isoform X1 [Sesbania bispinosa]|nr:protein FORGETTER 1 isoform X1 [Sesbania bispinosa]